MAFANTSFKGQEKMDGVLAVGSVIEHLSRYCFIYVCPASARLDKKQTASFLRRRTEKNTNFVQLSKTRTSVALKKIV